MALGYQNPFYLKQAQKKQQSLYDGKVLLEKHDPIIVHDLEETLQLAQETGSESRPPMLNKENYVSMVVSSSPKEEAGIQLQAEEYDLIATAADLDKIEEVNANFILMANLQQASSSGTQTNSVPVYDTDGSAETDSTPIYDSDGSAEVHEYCDNNEIFNMFTQEEQYTELLESILEPQQVPQNDNNVISEVTRVEQGGETVEQHSANFEETRALYESLYHNLAVEVEKVNSVNHKLKETNADLTTELARYKNQERYFEISQENMTNLKDEFAGELTLLKSISSGIDETDCDFKEDILLIEKLLYDNSSSRPPEEFVYANSDAASESFSPSPIIVKDSDSLMKEIDLLCTPDYPMPPGIEDKDYDSEKDILIPKDLPSNNSLSFAEKSHFILIFLRFLVLLQNHQMVIQES
nr:hypothetical protein [Tanacetum cinerariifolium]